MPSRILLTIVALACTANAPASPAEPLRPDGKWTLEYADSQCLAARTYQTAAGPILLAFRPSLNGRTLRMIVAKPGYVPDARHFDLSLSFGSAPTKANGLRFRAGDGKRHMIWISVDRAQLDELAKSGRMQFDDGGQLRETLMVSGLPAALTALDKCMADLRAHWNVDGGVTTAAEPIKPLHKLISWQDYPAQAMRGNDSGISAFELMIDDKGVLADCMIEKSSGVATLDAMSCTVLLERARYQPARDAAGKPVRSVQHCRVNWSMPK